jgi:hypothetical protein
MQILSSNISRLYRRIYIHQFLQQFFFLEILEYLIEERIYSDEVLLSVQYSVWQQYGDILARSSDHAIIPKSLVSGFNGAEVFLNKPIGELGQYVRR